MTDDRNPGNHQPPDDKRWSVACDDCNTPAVTFPDTVPGPWFRNRAAARHYAGYHHGHDHPDGDPVVYPEHWPINHDE